jgi:hypothetical protein
MARTLPIVLSLVALIGGPRVTEAAPPPMLPALPELAPPRPNRPEPVLLPPAAAPAPAGLAASAAGRPQ